MDCRTTSALKFRARLGFKQYDVILTKEQSVLTRIMSSFEGKNMQIQYNVLGYGIDLYFYNYKLAIEIDENGQMKKMKQMKQKYLIQKKKTKINRTRTWLL